MVEAREPWSQGARWCGDAFIACGAAGVEAISCSWTWHHLRADADWHVVCNRGKQLTQDCNLQITNPMSSVDLHHHGVAAGVINPSSPCGLQPSEP